MATYKILTASSIRHSSPYGIPNMSIPCTHSLIWSPSDLIGRCKLFIDSMIIIQELLCIAAFAFSKRLAYFFCCRYLLQTPVTWSHGSQRMVLCFLHAPLLSPPTPCSFPILLYGGVPSQKSQSMKTIARTNQNVFLKN